MIEGSAKYLRGRGRVIVNGKKKQWLDLRFCDKSQNIFLEKQVIPLPLVIYGRRKRSDCLQERERLVV